SFILLIFYFFLCSISYLGGSIYYKIQSSILKFSDIFLSLWLLPDCTAVTTIKMCIGLVISLLIKFIFGTWAAKNIRSESISISLVYILQSIPVLDYFSITVKGFLVRFPTSICGDQAAVIFGIITSQAWNM
ncbi:sulfonate ABC transporter permease, partial [Francisella tularensis]|nr:sulfonate ABC transporter permease [Francisella tularensis]